MKESLLGATHIAHVRGQGLCKVPKWVLCWDSHARIPDGRDDVWMRQGSRPVMTEQERLRRKELRRRPRMVTRARILGFLTDNDDWTLVVRAKHTGVRTVAPVHD